MFILSNSTSWLKYASKTAVPLPSNPFEVVGNVKTTLTPVASWTFFIAFAFFIFAVVSSLLPSTSKSILVNPYPLIISSYVEANWSTDAFDIHGAYSDCCVESVFPPNDGAMSPPASLISFISFSKASKWGSPEPCLYAGSPPHDHWEPELSISLMNPKLKYLAFEFGI